MTKLAWHNSFKRAFKKYTEKIKIYREVNLRKELLNEVIEISLILGSIVSKSHKKINKNKVEKND